MIYFLHRLALASTTGSWFSSSLGVSRFSAFPVECAIGSPSIESGCGLEGLGCPHWKQAYACVIFLEGVSRLAADSPRGPSFQIFERYIFKLGGASLRGTPVEKYYIRLETIWRVWSRRPVQLYSHCIENSKASLQTKIYSEKFPSPFFKCDFNVLFLFLTHQTN